MQRAIIWTAVSSEEQAADDKASLAHQEQLGRAAAARHGLGVVDVIRSDDSRSVVRLDVAMRNERLGYAALVDAIERRSFDVLIYYNADRLGRNRALAATVQEMCAAADIALYDLSNPPQTLSAEVTEAQRIVWSIQGANAQSDVEKFRRRVRFGRTARARRGVWLHKIPYGYTRAADGSLEIDPGPAAIVRRVFAEYLSGHGLPRIAADLNADGIPTPKGNRWQVGTVAYLLNNILRYAGWMEHNRYSRAWNDPYLRTRGQWPAIIDDATAEHIASERQQRAANRRLADTPHLLSGVAWCIECERPLRISTNYDNRLPRSYLRCTQKHGPFWQVRTERIMECIESEMTRLATADIDAMIGVPDTASAASTIAAIEADVARLRRSLQAADDAHFVAGTLDADRYARTVSRLQAEIAARQTELTQLADRQRRDADLAGKRARLLDVLTNGATILRSADATAANAWLRTHLRVWVWQKHPVIVEWL